MYGTYIQHFCVHTLCALRATELSGHFSSVAYLESDWDYVLYSQHYSQLN